VAIDALGPTGRRLPRCGRAEPAVLTLGQRQTRARKPKAWASLVQGRLLAIVVVATGASSPAQAGPDQCSQLKTLAANVGRENELVQEEHLPRLDPHWCQHARVMTNAMSVMIEIIESNSNHCKVDKDKFEALQTSNHRMIQLAEGCP
jgi:hypothetical protein